MSMDINRNTAGMMNRDNNLYDKAVELSKDGKLSKTDLKNLEKMAKSDGNYTGMERLFIDDLKKEGGAETFAHFAKEAEFNPSGFNWNVESSSTTVKSGNRKIELVFSENPSGAKEIKGDINSAKATMEGMIPDDKMKKWEKLDKHNINSVKNFINGLNLSTEDKANFVQSYMTAYFNHPGVDIKWDGAGLQEGINAVPKDENGRKYMDCESYAKTAQTLLGGNSSNFTTLGVASGANGSTRDHQVAVFRDGNDAYVISNNEITKVAGGASKSDDELVTTKYPDFSNVVVDPNGAMKNDTSVYSVGDTLNADNGTQINITSIDNATTMRGSVTDPGGNTYPVEVKVSERNGDYSFKPSFKAGDTISLANGISVTMTDNKNGVATLPDGTQENVKLKVNNNGTFDIKPSK